MLSQELAEHVAGARGALVASSGGPDSKRRVDFFCIGTGGRKLVVEVKRPKKPIGEEDVTQIINYVQYLRQHAPTSGQERSPNRFEGVLVGHHLSPEGIMWRETAANTGIAIRSWDELLAVAERIHHEFLEAMKTRVPDDARVQDIFTETEAEVEDGEQGS